MTDNGPQHYTEQQEECWEKRLRDKTWRLRKPSGFDFSHTYFACHIQLDFLRTRGLYESSFSYFLSVSLQLFWIEDRSSPRLCIYYPPSKFLAPLLASVCLPRDLPSLLGNKVKTQKYLKNKRHLFLYQEFMPSFWVLLKLCCISRALWCWDAYGVLFLLLWQNAWQRQHKGARACFSSGFERLQRKYGRDLGSSELWHAGFEDTCLHIDGSGNRERLSWKWGWAVTPKTPPPTPLTCVLQWSPSSHRLYSFQEQRQPT